MNKYFLTFALILMSYYSMTAQYRTNQDCFKCHSSSTLGELEESTGRYKTYYVNPEAYSKSNHKNLNCIDCHDSNYATWQHLPDSTKKSLHCLSCHNQDNPPIAINPKSSTKFKELNLDFIDQEFKKSIHRVKLGNNFDCFACHNPHEFERKQLPDYQKIESDNSMCFKCHLNEDKYSQLTNHVFPSIDDSHQWLPNAQLHWQSVRCVDCHSSYNGNNLSHLILPKQNAIKNCEKCHSKNSILLDKLYKFELKSSRDKSGFINGTILSNAYVIGSTKNELLDGISIAIFILSFIGIAIHGGYRIIINRKNASIEDNKND